MGIFVEKNILQIRYNAENKQHLPLKNFDFIKNIFVIG
jgi:hypothetical protein